MSRRPRAFLGTGVAFPVRPVHGRIPWAAHEDSIEQAIENILRTGRRERVMLPEFGAGLPERVFEPNAPATWYALEEDVRTALIDWEPRIDLREVRVTPGEAENVLLVHIDYVVRATNTHYNRVYPFYLSEGHG